MISDALHVFLPSLDRFLSAELAATIEALDRGSGPHAADDLQERLRAGGLSHAEMDDELCTPENIVALLSGISRHCAGVGAYVGQALLGEMLRRRYAPSLPSEGLCGPAFFEDEDPGFAEGRVDLSVAISDGTLTGQKRSVFLAPHLQRFAVVAQDKGGYELVWVDRAEARLSEPLELVGARALMCADVAFDRARILAAARLSEDDLIWLLGVWSLFTAACATGTAAAGLATAWEYAGQRYQGGSTIDKHDAVALLYSRNTALVDASQRAIAGAAGECSQVSRSASIRALRTKSWTTEAARNALSDAIQMHGGYGYMRDYGIEKRFRDAVTLSLLPLDNTRLTLFCTRLEGR